MWFIKILLLAAVGQAVVKAAYETGGWLLAIPLLLLFLYLIWRVSIRD